MYVLRAKKSATFVPNTNIYKIRKLSRDIFFVICNISLPRFAIVLNLRFSFQLQ